MLTNKQIIYLSPFLICLTSEPTSSATPQNSCPNTTADFGAGNSPLNI